MRVRLSPPMKSITVFSGEASNWLEDPSSPVVEACWSVGGVRCCPEEEGCATRETGVYSIDVVSGNLPFSSATRASASHQHTQCVVIDQHISPV